MKAARAGMPLTAMLGQALLHTLSTAEYQYRSKHATFTKVKKLLREGADPNVETVEGKMVMARLPCRSRRSMELLRFASSFLRAGPM